MKSLRDDYLRLVEGADEFGINSKELIDKLIQQDEQARIIIQHSKSKFGKDMLYYQKLANLTPVVVDRTYIPSMATNGVELFVHPEFVLGLLPERKILVEAKLKKSYEELIKLGLKTEEDLAKELEHLNKWFSIKNPNELAFLMTHEMEHTIRKHISRIGSRNTQLANVAMDHSINTDYVHHHYNDSKESAVEKAPILAEGCCEMKYQGWTFEKIYDDLLEEHKQKQSSSGNKDKGLSGAHMDGEGKISDEQSSSGNPLMDAMGIDTSQAPTITESEQQEIQAASRSNIENAAKLAGDGTPNHVFQVIGSFGKAKINYKDYIRKTLLSLVTSSSTYNRYNRRSYSLTQYSRANGGISQRSSIVLAGKEKEKKISLHIFGDTSGSISNEDLKNIMNEVVGITKQFKAFEITLASFDTEIHNPQKFTNSDLKGLLNYKWQGRGGTTGSVIFDHLEDCEAKGDTINQVIILTDLYIGSVDKYAKKYKDKTLWVVFDNPNWEAPFGKGVDYDKYA